MSLYYEEHINGAARYYIYPKYPLETATTQYPQGKIVISAPENASPQAYISKDLMWKIAIANFLFAEAKETLNELIKQQGPHPNSNVLEQTTAHYMKKKQARDRAVQSYLEAQAQFSSA
jgi:hypothetical protein